MATGATLFLFGFKTEEKQVGIRVVSGNVLYNSTLYVERFGYWTKEITLYENTTFLISVDVTGGEGNEEIHCIDLYVLNNASYFTWLQKHMKHREQASWFKWEEGLKYVSETVDRNGNYMLRINRTGTYYFVLDNSGRCAKKVFFRILEPEEVKIVSSSKNQPPVWASSSGLILLALGLTLLFFGLLIGRRVNMASTKANFSNEVKTLNNIGFCLKFFKTLMSC